MVRGVIDRDENRAQVRLPGSMRNLGREIDRAVRRQVCKPLPVRADRRNAFVPRRAGWWRRIPWPVALRPFDLVLVVLIHAEVEEAVLPDPNVLEQLPPRIRTPA